MGKYYNKLLLMISLFVLMIIPIAFSIDFNFTTDDQLNYHNCSVGSSGRSYDTGSNYSQSLLYPPTIILY
ncbi:hypothetical protein CASFOL_040965 [Castilleja foliolosa]|uniref:Secreted protein n=1 Tax=Castilleja foliolosa TaxID=1961234 RepID=A0ABD3BDQ7_9LAMI